MNIKTVEIRLKGKTIMVNSIRVDNQIFIITGKLIKTAKIKDDWYDNIEDPKSIISELKNVRKKADLFTFTQRLPETIPKFNYYMEWEKVTALPIISFSHWWEKQINSDTRKKAKRATKRGVKIKVVAFSDELVRGISSIFNEAPIRQGKPFWHYGKDFESVKKEMSLDLERCVFIGAYYDGQLIGILKLLYDEKTALPGIIVSMIRYRNKYVDNALMAKAVEICDKKRISYLTYGSWRRGSQADWLRRNGFEKKVIPRYYIPLTIKGEIVLKLNLHHGFVSILPEKLIVHLIELRKIWHSRKYRNVNVAQNKIREQISN